MPLTLFEENSCKGCELCIEVCPRKIIKLGDHLNAKGYHPAVITNMDQCTGCANCGKMCPDSVITVKK